MRRQTRAAAGFLAAVAAGFLAAAPLAAQDITYCDDGFRPSLSPAFVDGDLSFFERLALEVGATACRSGHGNVRQEPTSRNAQSFTLPGSWVLRADGRFVWAHEGADIPDATRVSLAAGGGVSIYRPPRLAPDDWPIDELPDFDDGEANWGFVDLAAVVGYEASKDRDETRVRGGFEARWAITTHDWRRHLPSVVGRHEWVEPLRSEAFEALGVPDADDGHRRWSVTAYASPALVFVDPRLRVEAEVSRHWAAGLDEVLEDTGWAAGTYWMAGLRWSADRTLVGPVTAESFFARYSAGRLPTSATERDGFAAGVTLGLR